MYAIPFQRVLIYIYGFNSLPDDKILNRSKLKAFTDDKINVALTTIFLFKWVENIVGKGENVGYHHFLLFPLCFQKASSSGIRNCVEKS